MDAYIQTNLVWIRASGERVKLAKYNIKRVTFMKIWPRVVKQLLGLAVVWPTLGPSAIVTSHWLNDLGCT